MAEIPYCNSRVIYFPEYSHSLVSLIRSRPCRYYIYGLNTGRERDLQVGIVCMYVPIGIYLQQNRSACLAGFQKISDNFQFLCRIGVRRNHNPRPSNLVGCNS